MRRELQQFEKLSEWKIYRCTHEHMQKNTKVQNPTDSDLALFTG